MRTKAQRSCDLTLYSRCRGATSSAHGKLSLSLSWSSRLSHEAPSGLSKATREAATLDGFGYFVTAGKTRLIWYPVNADLSFSFLCLVNEFPPGHIIINCNLLEEMQVEIDRKCLEIGGELKPKLLVWTVTGPYKKTLSVSSCFLFFF